MHNIKKYKVFESYEDIIGNIEDIFLSECPDDELELEIDTHHARHIGYFAPRGKEFIMVIISPKYAGDGIKLEELNELLLRLSNYLGSKWISSSFLEWSEYKIRTDFTISNGKIHTYYMPSILERVRNIHIRVLI